MDDRPKATSPAKRILQTVLSLAIVVGIFVFAFPQFADYGDVWTEITAMTVVEMLTLLAVAIWNLVTYWFVLTAVMPGLTYPQAAVSNQASTAVANTLPGGGAIAVGVTYAMYRSWGFGKSEFALAAVVSGVWNNFAKLGMPVLALALLALEGEITAARVIAAVAGIGVLIGFIALWSLFLFKESLARRIGSFVGRVATRVRALVGKPPVSDWGESGVGFRARALVLLRTRWLRLTLATLVSHTSLWIVLLITLRHVGVGNDVLSWIEVLAVFAFIRLISALPITPGGVGVVELGMTVGLQVAADFTGVSEQLFEAKIAAAVLVFRAITFLLPVPLGAASYLIWRANSSWRTSTPSNHEEGDGAGGDAQRGSADAIERQVGTDINP
ncbi:MAG: YbhN family protein [Acidimicrobiia bacterium]|nr:YbhN family protein [Acidimicrobiia bacterium]